MDPEDVRDQVGHAYQDGLDAVVALVGAVMAQLAAVVARVGDLEAENAALRARLGTDSHNSSKPPSSDGPGATPHPRSQRVRSGRRPGGQPGHTGHTLRLVDAPDAVHRSAPVQCQACGRCLEWVPALRRERRQLVDLPPVQARVSEYQVETKRCPGCGTESRGEFPAGVTAPVQYGPGVVTLAVYLNQEQLLPSERTGAVLAEVFGCPMADGTLERAVGDCHARLAETAAAIQQGVEQAAVAHFDETGLRIAGATAWLHMASTAALTCFATHPKRGREALDAIGLLARRRGRALHDGWSSSWRYEQCGYALCNGHHLRELTFVEEELGQPWAGDLKAVLREIKQAVEAARGQGLAALPAEATGAFERRYDVLLAEGFRANPRPARTGKPGRPKRGTVRCLLERLHDHREPALACMHDVAVPFDNNQAERDLRMTKVREKISGCFRTTAGAEQCCRIRGYLSTLRKQGMPILAALGQAISGIPPRPVTT